MNKKAEIERIMRDLAPRADGTKPTIDSRHAARIFGIPHHEMLAMIEGARADGAPPDWFIPQVETDQPPPPHVEFPPPGSQLTEPD